MKKTISLLLAAALLLALVPASVLAADESAPKDTAIHEVNIKGFLPPVVGSTPEFSYTLYVEEGLPYFILYPYWHDNTLGTDMFVEQEPFVADHMYSAGCIICIEDGYYLADDCVFSFNGDPALADPDYPQPFYLDGCVVLQSVPVAPVTSAATPGDVDGDGAVTVADALLTLRAAMGIVELTDAQLHAADIDGSGAANLTDALVILRAAMGLIPAL